jgi:hypothetical protein
VCESRLIVAPIAPCEILPSGAPGLIEINSMQYSVAVLGYLPDEGEPVIDGYRLTKGNGEAHDICLVRGRMECSCGDWIWRRAAQAKRELQSCKHIISAKRHLVTPVDQKPAPLVSACELEDL